MEEMSAGKGRKERGNDCERLCRSALLSMEGD